MNKSSSDRDQNGDYSNCYIFTPTFSQERLWFLAQLDPSSDVAYHLHAAVRLTGYVDTVLLQRAFDHVVSLQESLRTGLALIEGSLHQVVLPIATVMIPTIDCGGPRESDSQVGIDQLMIREIRRPFALDNPPLIRMILFRLANDEYTLLLVMHHLVADGWSVNILLREFASQYSLLAAGSVSASPGPTIQYGDYAVWQRENVTRDSIGDQMTYWRNHLAGVPPLEIPTDSPRPATRSGRGAVCRNQIDAKLLDALIDIGRRHQATLFMVLLTGFSALLGRYSGQSDFAVGTAIANRRSRELEDIIGLFANTLAIRADLTGDPSFSELIDRIRIACLGAYEHQDLPFEWLVEELHPVRDLGRSPLFQVMLVLNEGTPGLTIPGVSMDTVRVLDSGTAKFDLFLSAAQEERSLSLALEFSTDLFDMRTARLLLAYYEQILVEFSKEPSQKIMDVALTIPHEIAPPVTQTDARADGPAGDGPVGEIITIRARSNPDAIAVSDEERSLSYQQLIDRADRLAGRLSAAGVRTGDIVAVCLPRSADVVACLLAIGISGAAYLPIDTTLPPARSSYMMQDAGVRALVTSDPCLMADLNLADCQIVVIDEALPSEPPSQRPTADHSAAAQERAPHCHNGIAYLIYTSGSTGRPKGVEVSHRNLTDQLTAMRAIFDFSAADVLVAVTSMSFDIAALEMFLPLLCGGRVVIASAETAADGERLAELISTCGATVLQATPATWRLLLAAGWDPPAGFRVLCGGEALDAELAERLTRTSAQVWNLYGPTEATIWASAGLVTDPRCVRLGRPLPGTSRYLLGRRQSSVPLGACGELYLGGRCVAVGYHGAGALTAQRFLPDPSAHTPGARMYRTGDLCRYTVDGELQFIGRADDQVKIRGFRVNISEIEAVLASTPDVDQVVVVPRSRGTDDLRLMAFIVPSPSGQGGRGGAEADPTDIGALLEQLRMAAARELPPYAIPAAFGVLPKIPLTPSGKVDRRALASLAIEPTDQGDMAAPRTGTEHKIAQAFAEVLDVRSIGVFSNFFDLGGHSLLAARLTDAIRKETGQAMPVRVLFENPTVEGLAARIDTMRASEQAGHATAQIHGQVERFSDAQVDDLLRQLLAERAIANHQSEPGGIR